MRPTEPEPKPVIVPLDIDGEPDPDACPDCGEPLRWGPWCPCGYGAELDEDTRR